MDRLAEDDPQAYADFLKSQARTAEAEQKKELVRGGSAQFVIEARLLQPAGAAVAVHVWAARDGEWVWKLQ